MTREQFIEKCERLFVEKGKFLEMVNKALDSGAVNYENAEDNYAEVYPVVTAVYERLIGWYITGYSNPAPARRKANNIKKFI